MRTRLGFRPFDRTPESIDDQEWVSQYGSVEIIGMLPFRNDPRPVDRGQLSVQRGRKSVEQMAKLVRRRNLEHFDRVRYARVASLREQGFEVRHIPDPGNPDHAVIAFPSMPDRWDNERQLAFDAAFEAGGDEQ